MDATDPFDDDLPPKRGKPPPFRRNRIAAGVTLGVLAFAAGMGVQWGLNRRAPAGPTPSAALPKEAATPVASPARARPEVLRTAVAELAAPPAQAAAPTPVAAPTPAPAAATVGISRRALLYGQLTQPQPAAAPAPETPRAEAPPPARPEEKSPVETEPPKPALSKAGATASVRERPRPVRVASRGADPGPPPRPSFDCARASTPGERAVCGDPRLAVLDRRMDAAFRRALAGARDPRGLKADQDRWMAVREGAALRDPTMIGPAYESRIAELDAGNW